LYINVSWYCIQNKMFNFSRQRVLQRSTGYVVFIYHFRGGWQVYVETVACTEYSESTLSHINRFTVNPNTLSSPSNVRQLITHSLILIILVTSLDGNKYVGLPLPLGSADIAIPVSF